MLALCTALLKDFWIVVILSSSEDMAFSGPFQAQKDVSDGAVDGGRGPGGPDNSSVSVATDYHIPGLDTCTITRPLFGVRVRTCGHAAGYQSYA